MRAKALGTAVIFTITLGVLTTPTSAQQLSPEMSAQGWISLFDGKTLEGWRVIGDPKNWEAKDGLLVLHGGSGMLATEWEFEDFQLHIEWRAEKAGYNSGIYIRCPRNQGANQIQLGQGGEGSFFGKAEGTKNASQLCKKPGEWNVFDIYAVASRLILYVNGQLAWDAKGFMTPRGCIGIEAEGAHIDFRNIFIREIGFKPLFNGTNLDAWTNQNWVVENGVMMRPADKGVGDTRTKDEFDDFILRLEYRIPQGGNSGVYVRSATEVQVFGDYGAQPSAGGNGAIYGVKPPDKNMLKTPNDWNYLEITCKGKQMRVWLNGEVIHDINWDNFDALKNRPLKGYILLQDHGSKVEYRNIRIKPLT